MKVYFLQSGGFAGLVRQCELDTQTLDAEQARELERLVKESGIAASGEYLCEGARDAYQYRITIEEEPPPIVVIFEDGSVPDPARRLVGYLKRHAV